MAPQRKNAGKTVVAADPVDESSIRAATATTNAAPTAAVTHRSGASIVAVVRPRSPAARIQAEVMPEAPAANGPITLRDIQHLIQVELRQMFQEATRNDQPAVPRSPARSLARSLERSPVRSPLGPRRAAETGRGTRQDSPNRSRTTALERLGSRGARLARERQDQGGRDLLEQRERRRELPEESTGESGKRTGAVSAGRDPEELRPRQRLQRREEASAGRHRAAPRRVGKGTLPNQNFFLLRSGGSPLL